MVNVEAPRLSIPDSLGSLAATAPQSVAIVGHGCGPLTYGRLYLHLLEVGRALNALGVGRDDRVALVAPSGPETAVALLAVAASATCVPLNPSCSADELAFYLADARASAVMVSANVDSPVRRVARQGGIPILELDAQGNGTAGLITVTGDAARPSDQRRRHRSRRYGGGFLHLRHRGSAQAGASHACKNLHPCPGARQRLGLDGPGPLSGPDAPVLS